MRKVSMATRRELVAAVGERYRAADRASKGKVLDEFVAVTGLHRKHTMRILRQIAPSRRTSRTERQIYTRGGADGANRVVGGERSPCAARGCGRSCRFQSKPWKAMAILTWIR